jgi:hypothetical protein
MPSKKTLLGIFGIILLCCIIVFSLSLKKVTFSEKYQALTDYAPLEKYSSTFPHQVLLYSQESPQELVSIRRKIRAGVISGCVITTMPTNWNSDTTALINYRRDCKRVNKYFKNNYIRISLADKNLPTWDDLAAWKTINDQINTICHFARKTGFIGFVIDTRDPEELLWNPEWNTKYKTISDDFASKVIYQRGREIIQTIDSVYPNSQILVLSLGVNDPPLPGETISRTAYWIHFANGLLSTQHPGKIGFIVDYPELITKQHFQNYSITANTALNTLLDEKQYWQKNGSISYLLRTQYHDDYQRIYTHDLDSFQEQFLRAQQFTTKYVLVQLTPQASSENTVSAFQKYEPILTSVQDPQLRLFYRYLATKHPPNMLELLSLKMKKFLHEIFNI